MKTILLAALLSIPLAAQTVLPPGTAATEQSAWDGDAWTYRTFRASVRYPASWVQAPKTITQIAWRADATYNWTYDRLPGQMTLRVGPWMGDTAIAWTPRPITWTGAIDPPNMVVTQAWTPQPFTFIVPLTTPVVIAQGGLEIDVAFVGPWDPTWGNRATYWVDCAGGGIPSSLADAWLDTVPPYMGCAGWISETRADRQPGSLTMEVRYTNLPLAPAIIAVGSSIQDFGCADIAGQVFIGAVTDAAGWLQLHFPNPTTSFSWAWQGWVYDATRPPDQCFGSGHWCNWAVNAPWPSQVLYAYDDQAAQPSYTLPGTAWVVEVR